MLACGTPDVRTLPSMKKTTTHPPIKQLSTHTGNEILPSHVHLHVHTLNLEGGAKIIISCGNTAPQINYCNSAFLNGPLNKVAA